MGLKTDRKQNNKKIIWVLGAIGLFLLSKGKALLIILKASKYGGALISIFVSIWAYALLFPISTSIGLVVMILIHELGHVFAAKQKGLPVSAPMFIPFLGAFIMMKKHPKDAATEAYVAIGGPVLGTVGALVTLWLGLMWDSTMLIVIAKIGFLINLINLLPIHPLDGGRIATAVTRWLWLVGLVGGLIVIVYLKSPLLFIIWALFAWELYQKYVKNKGKGRSSGITSQIEVPFAYIQMNGYIIPEEGHRRELAYQTYSNIEGQEQKVTVHWPSIGLNQTISLPQQGLLHKVHITRIQHLPEEAPSKLLIHCKIEYELFENDQYYEVSASTRKNFGLAYGALALILFYMLHVISDLDLRIG